MNKTISKQQLKQIINEALNELQTEATTAQILGRQPRKVDPDDAANAIIAQRDAIIAQREREAELRAKVGSQSFRPVSLQPSARSKSNKIRAISKKQNELMVQIKEIEDQIMEIAYGEHKYTDLQRTRFFNKYQNKKNREEFVEYMPESKHLWEKRAVLRREFSELAGQLKKLYGLPDDF